MWTDIFDWPKVCKNKAGAIKKKMMRPTIGYISWTRATAALD